MLANWAKEGRGKLLLANLTYSFLQCLHGDGDEKYLFENNKWKRNLAPKTR